jgi:hypothetical protein
MTGSESIDRLYGRVDHALRALILVLGTWALYAQIGVLARVPFTTLRLFSFLPLLATAFLLRVTARRVEPCDAVPMSDQPAQLSWFSSPILRFGGPLAVAALFFFTKSEWAFWIPAVVVLTAEVWFAPPTQYAGEDRPSNLSGHLEVAGLVFLCVIATGATAGLIRPDNDDAYFVNVATSVNEFPSRPALSFDAMHRDGLPPVEQALHLPQSYEVLVGLVSSVTGVSVPTLYYVFFPLFWTVLGTLAHWLVLRHLLPRREAILATAIWVFIIIFWGDGLRAFGSFGFARIFQGKAIFLVVVAPLIVLAALRYRQRPSLPHWICLALTESAATALTTNAIIIGPLLAAFAIAAPPRWDRQYLRALAGGAAASLPVILMAALMHSRLSPFMTPEDPDPFFRPYLTTLGFTRTPLVLLAIMMLPVLATRARLACADWIRSYVWLVLTLVFLPVTADLATLALGNTFSWRIFWSAPVPLLVSLAGGIAAGGLLNRRWVPEAAIVGWLLVFAFAAAPTFAQSSWSLHNVGRPKVAEPRYSAARTTVSLARPDAPALVTEAVAVYMTGMPGGPPLVGVRSLYLRKLRHLIPDGVLARRLELFAYVARGGRGVALADDLEEITRWVGGDPFLSLDAALKGIDAAGVATVVVREDHPDLSGLETSLGDRGFIIHRVGGFVIAALPR